MTHFIQANTEAKFESNWAFFTSLPMALPLYVGLRVPLHYLDALQQNDLLVVTLQDASQGKCSENIIYLYGGFQTRVGKQVLVLGPSHHIPRLSSNALLAHLSSWTANTTNWTHQFYNALIVSHKKHQMQNCQLFDTVILQVPFRAFLFRSFVSSDMSPWIITKLGFWLGFSLRAVASVPRWWKNYSCTLCEGGSTSNCWGTCSRGVAVLGSFWQIQTNTKTPTFHHKIVTRNIQRAGFYAPASVVIK